MESNNDTRNRNVLYIVLGIVITISICVGLFVFGGFAITKLFNDADIDLGNIVEIIEDPSEIILENFSQDAIDIDLEGIFIPFWESYDHLHNFFINQPINDRILAEGAIEGVLAYLDEEKINIDEIVIPEDAPSPESLSRQAKTPNKAKDEFLGFWEVWQKLLYADLEDNLAYDFVMQYALSYMALALDDPYTSYLDPVQYHMNQEVLDPTGYEGIGAWVDTTTDYITVIGPMSDSPAEKAGLRPDDKIIAIDGEDMTGVDGSLALRKVLGPAGSIVILRILRGDLDPFDVEIKRANIQTPAFRSEMLENDIAYLRIFSFSVNSPEEVRSTLEDLLAENPKGLILDLRFNPGGYVNQVIQITSEFLTEGNVMFEQYGDGSKDTFEVLPGGIALDIPMVLLINEGSASASEILAGALQDHGRAILVGDTTFGKGSVLVNVPLSNEQGSMSITVADWLSPDGRHIQDVGIDPDYFIEFSQEDADAGIDPQLDKAIELLTTP